MISEKLKLDDIDRQIITLVQENPSLTHTQIAEKISIFWPRNIKLYTKIFFLLIEYSFSLYVKSKQ